MWLLLGGWWLGIGLVAKYMRGLKVAQHSIRFHQDLPLGSPRSGFYGSRLE